MRKLKNNTVKFLKTTLLVIVAIAFIWLFGVIAGLSNKEWVDVCSMISGIIVALFCIFWAIGISTEEL